MNKLISIDLLRGFAAFTVFYYHQQLGAVAAKYTGLKFFELTDHIGSTFAVPLFFLLSGFCIHLSNLTRLKANESLLLKKYYQNRFFRIYPAYFFALILSVIIISITNPTDRITNNDLLVHFLVGQGFSSTYFNTINLILWTITIEIAFYIIYPLYYYMNRRFNANKALLFSLVITIISNLLFYLLEDEQTIPQKFFFTNIWLGWCYGAWLCDQYFRNQPFFKSSKWLLIVVLTICAYAGFMFTDLENNITLKMIFDIIIWSPILIFLIRQEKYLIKIEKYLKIPIAIGLSSYSLYLLHMPLILIKNKLIMNIENNTLHLLAMFFGTLLIPLICYFNYRIIEIPFLRLKKNFTGNKPRKMY